MLSVFDNILTFMAINILTTWCFPPSVVHHSHPPLSCHEGDGHLQFELSFHFRCVEECLKLATRDYDVTVQFNLDARGQGLTSSRCDGEGEEYSHGNQVSATAVSYGNHDNPPPLRSLAGYANNTMPDMGQPRQNSFGICGTRNNRIALPSATST